MNMSEKYKPQIDIIWAKETNSSLDEVRIPPIYPGEVKENAILIVGLNPSLSKGEEERLLKKYTEKNDDKGKADEVQDDEKVHKYFRRFPKLVGKTHFEWTHIDLLFFQKTNSKSAKWLWKNHPEFIKDQLAISINILKEIKPKVIIVNNAFSSELIKSYQKEGNYTISDFNENIGTYLFNDNIPIFFSSMIEGPSPMDNGTFERLQWHINFTLKKMTQ